MSNADIQWWSLVIGLLTFASVIGAVYLRRRIRTARGATAERSDRWSNVPSPVSDAPAPATVLPVAERRRPAAEPPHGTPQERMSAVRSLILRVAAERAPAGWLVLILTPPPHTETMTWHVHLAPAVALDLKDGRTIPAAQPTPSHQWQLAGGRRVGVGQGTLDPSPTGDTVSIRISGPYLVVIVSTSDRGQLVTARVVTTGDALPEPQAPLADTRAVQAALREAIELAVGSRMTDAPPVLGYRTSAWDSHDQTWLTILR